MEKDIVEDLNCPVCYDIFNDPVILNCSHSFCKACLDKYWDRKGSRECPICMEKSTQNEPTTNRVLKGLCESLKKKSPSASAEPDALCDFHGEKLKLFCLDDEQLMCLLCRDAKIHVDHKFHPVCDVATEYKEEMKTRLQPLLLGLTEFENVKMAYNQALQNIKTQANHTERKIKQDFEMLHQFLCDEEKSRISALKKEDMQKTKLIEQEIEKISREILSLSGTIRDIKDAVGTDSVTFLKNYKSTVERTQCTLENPKMVSGALIDVAKHLGNLKFEVWKGMQCVVEYAPVILDPNTAHPNLTVSEDLMGAQYRQQKQQLPDNPERFDEYPSVLGYEGFTSGTHSWDVEVGDSPNWEVGVMLDSAKVKGTDENQYFTGSWVLIHADDEYKAHSGHVSLKRMLIREPLIPLKVKEKPKRIRVEVSLNKGRVSFSDPDNNTLLHTFTHMFFLWNKDGKAFPYFKTHSSLRILPVKAVTVAVKEPS